MNTTSRPPTAPPPGHWSSQPPPAAAIPTTTRPDPGTHGESRPDRPWRDRLPELIGGIGTVLVIAAIAGFLSASWEELDQLGKAIVLGAAAGGLTAAAMFLQRRAASRLASLTSMLWVAGSATAGASVLLGVAVALPAAARVTALAAGLTIATHAALALRRHPSSTLPEIAVVAGLLVAAGPFGSSINDRATWDTLGQLFQPIAGLVDPSLQSDAFLITGVAHLLLGAGWLVWARSSTGDAARTGWIGSTALLSYAALELHVLPWGIGAFVALLIVLGYLVHGLVRERAGAVVAGTIGALIAGGRVLWSLFSGEALVTVAAFSVGLALLTWAVRARQGEDARQSDDHQDNMPDEQPAMGHTSV
jgi:nitrogen fixation-related uncharacterized protein